MKRDGPGGTPDSDDTTNPEGNTEPTGDGEDTQDGEPNVERFTHSDLACKIVRTNLGHWCGYVRRPEDAEPIRWTSDYDSKHDHVIDAEVDVWGGITYGPDDDGWVGFDDAHARDLVDHREADDARGAVRLETKRLAEQIQELREENQAVTDGGLDAETVIGTVDPGDVVVVAGSPYRVVDVEADEDDGVLRLYDLVERTETVKAAGAGDVDVYLHRSEDDAIQTRVQEEREQRDDLDDDVDRGDGPVTDGGRDLYGCDTPTCDGEKEVITPDGYVCRDCADALAVQYEEVERGDGVATDGGLLTGGSVYHVVCSDCTFEKVISERHHAARAVDVHRRAKPSRDTRFEEVSGR